MSNPSNDPESLTRRAIELHQQGHTWQQAADSIGVSIAQLRSWRGQFVESGDPAPPAGAAPVPITDANRPEIKIFISHRHEDQRIAETLQKALLSWGFTREQIFFSSDPRSGVKPGEPINETIKDFLWDCHLVLQVYTSSSHDWQWCALEVGIALDKRVATKIVHFQVLDGDAPKLRQEYKIVRVEEKAIYGFVYSLFKDEDFFPSFGPWQPQFDDDAIKATADKLYGDLRELSRNYEAEFVPEPRWGTVTLQVAGDVLEPLRKEWGTLDGDDEQMDLEGRAVESLIDNLRIVGSTGWGLEHFGYHDPAQAVADELTLRDVWRQWRSEVDEPGEEPDRWIQDLALEIWRSRLNKRPWLEWKPVPSAVRHRAGKVYPVLTTLYKGPKGSRKYEVHLFLFDEGSEPAAGSEASSSGRE